MSVSRKGKRLLTVGDARYFWHARGTDHGIAVSVMTDDAFVHGQRGQRLDFAVSYDALVVAHDTCWSLHARATVTPGVVRRAIDLATRADPPFTGRDGEPDILLGEEDVRRAIAEPPFARIEADLGRAEAQLAALAGAVGGEDHDAALVPEVEVLLGRWVAIGRVLQLVPQPDGDALVEAWFQRNAPAIERIVPGIQAAACAIEQTLTTPRPDAVGARERCYERRSALAFFLDLGKRAGLGDVLARVDTAAADRQLRAARPTKFAPPGIPPSHWWWGVRLPF